MNQSARLERRYQRLLACYPRAFRRENEDEILAVLLVRNAVARDLRDHVADPTDQRQGGVFRLAGRYGGGKARGRPGSRRQAGTS